MQDNTDNIENLELASNQKRMLAFIIDDFAVTFMVMAILWNQITATSGNIEDVMIVMNNALIDIIVLKFLYQTFFVWQYGATLGKLVAKTKVIDYNNFGQVSLSSSAMRSIGRIVSEMFFYAGFIMSYFNDGKQTLHDKLAKTLVVVDKAK
jgi:uncharacterized RDD family membrane protein YckC